MSEEDKKQHEEATDSQEIEDEKVEIPVGELEELKRQRREFEDKFLRRTADLDNLRKRQQKERREMLKYASKDLLADLLDVVDNFDRAFESMQFENEEVRDGMDMIRQQLHDLLEKYHVRPIEAHGQPFNPHEHEGMMREVRDDLDRQMVIEEFKKGFKLHDRILRPSAVKVGVPGSPGNEADVEAQE